MLLSYVQVQIHSHSHMFTHLYTHIHTHLELDANLLWGSLVLTGKRDAISLVFPEIHRDDFLHESKNYNDGQPLRTNALMHWYSNKPHYSPPSFSLYLHFVTCQLLRLDILFLYYWSRFIFSLLTIMVPHAWYFI